MKLVKLAIPISAEELISVLSDSNAVNENVKFDSKKGKPQMTLKQKGNKIRIGCTYVGGENRDNGYLVGTYFSGKITEKNGLTVLKGHIVTSPWMHLALFVLMALFIVQCIRVGGFSPVPVILFFFSIFMFRDEYRKQGIIYRYLLRALRKAEKTYLNS